MSQTPVCRSIRLNLIDQSRQKHGEPVVTTPVPKGRTTVDAFLKAVIPKVKIEHVGRSSMVSMSDKPRPSSLFFQGLHEAFAEHYPFALRPEVFMYLIAFNVAETVKRHPEDYHSLFTTSSGKQTIEVQHDGLVRGDPKSPWHEVFPLFNGALRKKVPAGIMTHMLPGFSTATPESDAASMLAFMDAASPFYDYRVKTRCGIPEIRMLGTAEDWQKLKSAAAMLAEPFAKHLGPYFTNLLPVLATLAEQANGGCPQDDAFWSSIYKWESKSSGDTFGGWTTAFLHFVQEDGKLVEKRSSDWRRAKLTSGCAPAHVSTVPFIWDYLGTDIPMTFAGGVLGLDVEDGYLTPALSYAVLEAAT